MDVLKVSSKSKPNSVAGALANAFKSRHEGDFVWVTIDGAQDGDLTGYISEGEEQ